MRIIKDITKEEKDDLFSLIGKLDEIQHDLEDYIPMISIGNIIFSMILSVAICIFFR